MRKITVVTGDITALKCDAIVNAANCSLLGGGGVDGAIHRAAGPELLAACVKFGGCRTGEAVITPGFRVAAKYVIHTPGPVWHGGTACEANLLADSYRNSLFLASKYHCNSIAFPCISCGAYRFPHHEAARIATDTVTNWNEILPEEVIFCCFNNADAELYRELLSARQKDGSNGSGKFFL